MTRTKPDAIYLQWPEIDDEADDALVSWEDVTWAEDQIEDTDPKYLRATPVREAAEAMLQALRDTLIDLRVARVLSEKGFDKTIHRIESAIAAAEPKGEAGKP